MNTLVYDLITISVLIFLGVTVYKCADAIIVWRMRKEGKKLLSVLQPDQEKPVFKKLTRIGEQIYEKTIEIQQQHEETRVSYGSDEKLYIIVTAWNHEPYTNIMKDIAAKNDMKLEEQPDRYNKKAYTLKWEDA